MWLVIVPGVFAALIASLRDATDPVFMPFLCIGFCCLCGMVGLAMLIAPSRLEIGPSGIVQKVLWRTTRMAWTDVYNFRPAVIGLANKAVGFDYLTERPKGGALRGLNTALAGVQGSLQPGWEINPQALASMLNEARERWLTAAEAAPRTGPADPYRPSLFAGVAGARINRKTYWLITGVVFAVAIALAFIPGAQRGVGGMTTVFFIRIFASRLHDFGRSGWWQLILYGIQLPAIILVGVAGGQPVEVMVAAGLVIQLVFTATLGAIPGDRDANRFGPPPGQLSPMAKSEPFR
jgi:uncharacterized membrane protein YhaH (DUF805 family)